MTSSAKAIVCARILLDWAGMLQGQGKYCLISRGVVLCGYQNLNFYCLSLGLLCTVLTLLGSCNHFDPVCGQPNLFPTRIQAAYNFFWLAKSKARIM
jgi:hypothetical protein